MPEFPGFRLAQHPLIADALPVPAGGESAANEPAARARAELRRLADAGDFEGVVRLHEHDHWAKALLAYRARLTYDAYCRLAEEF